MIELRNVSKRYGHVSALSHVSMTVEKGAITGLLGQNGAGKTTLINILTGYLAPSEGQALIDGHDVLMQPELAKRLLGYLPEQPPLYDEMTVESYLRFCAMLKGVTAKAIPRHIGEIMEKTGLTDMRRRLLGQLSKGYRQRAGFAQALCGDPEVLVLDEPTVGLDPMQILEIRQLITSLRGGHTILFSSHILPEVSQLCDNVVILNHGHIVHEQKLGASAQGETTLRLKVLGEEKRLLPRLNQLSGVTRVICHPLSDGQTQFVMTFMGLAWPEKQVFGLLSGLGTTVLELTRAQDTLESIFLQAVSEG